ncbi:MAG: fatty acid desaturase [Maritimibacter sp.]|nr:fatty acid desaturase [Maritimibacter sp.]
MTTLRQRTRAYTTRDNRRAALNIAATMTVYIGGLLSAIHIVRAGYWLAAVPVMFATGVSAVRLYMLQHDCGHGSFFTRRKANDIAGTLLSPFTLTPYKAIRYNHNLHHAHIGNLDRRDSTEIYVMTVEEYLAAPWWRKLGYRFYRSSVLLFLIGPTLLYVLRYRWPRNTMKSGLGNLLLHNALLALLLGALWAGYGSTGLLVWLGSVVLGVSSGVLIPYVQHNFEDVFWSRPDDLSFDQAAVEGSAVLDFGAFFDLCTANIAYHDLHHLNSNIPCYNLKRCYRDLEGTFRSRKIGFREALGCLRWKLWDEDTGRMAPFPRRGAMPSGQVEANSTI